VDDILSQGGDREPGPWPRRLVMIVALIVVVTGGAALATGRHTVIALPAGSSAASGVFSPDGRFLALQVSFGNTGDGGDLAMQLEVAPMTSGRLAVVPGTFVSSDALVGFGWPAGGDSLVAEFSFTTKMQLASWHPGASRPAVTVIPPGRSQASLILG
jgi:hypothetical protein